MHILVFPSFYPSAVRPLTGIFFKEQAEALHQAGHQVGVLVAPRIRESLHYIQTHRRLPDLQTAILETDTDLPVYRMHWGWFLRIFPNICAWLTTPAGYRAFARYCDEQGKPDIIHAHNIFYSGYMASRIRRRFNIPVVLTEHSSSFVRRLIFLPGQHRIVRQTLREVDAAAAVGASLQNILNAYLPERPVGLLPNIARTDFFIPSESPLPEPFTFALVTTILLPLKGAAVLLRAFATAFRGGHERLLVVGEGGEQVALQQMAQQLGIAAQVEFRGRLSRQGVRDIFYESHVVVSASYVETFGITLIEAMACGKPVIATRSGGPDNWITPETGLLVPTGDVPALAAALQDIRTHYERYSSAAVRQYCIDNFSQSAVVRQIETTYAAAIENFQRTQQRTAG
ncbi:glycosyltransferase family 4 protein [Anaerolineae bacterium CFX8]|nr:glycosyltransferase family 4 protein [Anaerolineae bacterium CFX8]